MARLIHVGDLHDVPDDVAPLVADYRGLRDVQLRSRVEPERGVFLAEGEKVIRRARAAGLRPRSFLMAPRWLAPLADVLDTTDPHVPCLVAPEATIERISGFHVHRGALASIWRPPERDAADVLRVAGPSGLVVVLDDLVDHTNVGAVVRGAAAFGAGGLLLGPGCADPLYRRAVKVAMGAVFTLPYARVDPATAGRLLRADGWQLWALTLAPDAVPLDDAVRGAPAGGAPAEPPVGGPARRVALLLGAEGAGVSPGWLAQADLAVRIPIAADVDSLNVAAAAAVALYAVTRR